MLDIVLLGGQSNAVGFSPWSNGLKNYDNVLYFGDGVGIESSENSIEKLPTLEWTTVKKTVWGATKVKSGHSSVWQTCLQNITKPLTAT